MRINLTEEDKKLALAAAVASDKLMHVWSYMNEDRSNDKDFEDALKHTETLVAFGQMIEEKLRPEPVEIPEPQPEETSPETVKTPNPPTESTDCGSGSNDSSPQETRAPSDVGADEVQSDKASLSFFQRLFHRS